MTNDTLAAHSARLLAALDFAEEAAAREDERRAEAKRLLLSLLEVLDCFDRLAAAAGADGRVELATVRRIAGLLEGALGAAGLCAIPALGQAADPEVHEIVDLRPNEDTEDDVIVDVARRGWEWQGELLRRPQVVVARTTRKETKQ